MKAEVLITRRCNLHCSYCNMPTNKAELTPAQWIEIFNVLTDELGCPFYPVYGAEPLLYGGIYEIVSYFADSKKNAFSLLTNATMLNGLTRTKLLDAGLNSITLSIDDLFLSHRPSPTENLKLAPRGIGSIAFRESRAWEAIKWATGSGIKDIQCTSTVHRQNIEYVPDLVRYLSDKGVWYSFDMIHDNKSELGYYPRLSKVSGRSDLYSFTDYDLPKIEAFLREMREMKLQGFKIYQPVEWFDFLLEEPDIVVYRDWLCDGNNITWVTLDSDGQVLICDDYLHPSGIYAADLPKQWDNFYDFRYWAIQNCRSCIWSTHWLSEQQLGKEGSISQVTHGRI